MWWGSAALSYPSRRALSSATVVPRTTLSNSRYDEGIRFGRGSRRSVNPHLSSGKRHKANMTESSQQPLSGLWRPTHLQQLYYGSGSVKKHLLDCLPSESSKAFIVSCTLLEATYHKAIADMSSVLDHRLVLSIQDRTDQASRRTARIKACRNLQQDRTACPHQAARRSNRTGVER